MLKRIQFEGIVYYVLRTTTCLYSSYLPCFLISFDILKLRIEKHNSGFETPLLLPKVSYVESTTNLQNKETFEFVGREIPLNPRFGVGPT